MQAAQCRSRAAASRRDLGRITPPGTTPERSKRKQRSPVTYRRVRGGGSYGSVEERQLRPASSDVHSVEPKLTRPTWAVSNPSHGIETAPSSTAEGAESARSH